MPSLLPQHPLPLLLLLLHNPSLSFASASKSSTAFTFASWTDPTLATTPCVRTHCALAPSSSAATIRLSSFFPELSIQLNMQDGAPLLNLLMPCSTGDLGSFSLSIQTEPRGEGKSFYWDSFLRCPSRATAEIDAPTSLVVSLSRMVEMPATPVYLHLKARQGATDFLLSSAPGCATAAPVEYFDGQTGTWKNDTVTINTGVAVQSEYTVPVFSEYTDSGYTSSLAQHGQLEKDFCQLKTSSPFAWHVLVVVIVLSIALILGLAVWGDRVAKQRHIQNRRKMLTRLSTWVRCGAIMVAAKVSATCNR